MSEAVAQKSNVPPAMVFHGARDVSPKERKFDPIGMTQSRALMFHRDNPDVPKGLAIPYGWRLEILLNGTPSTQPDFYVPAYVWTKRFVTRQPYYGATTGTSAKIMVPSPRVGCLHIFDYCQVFNNDASTRTATIRLTNGSTIINLVSQVIPPAETLFLQDGQWSVTYRGVAIPVAAGGTGLTTVPIGSLLYGQGTNPMATLAIGTASQFLQVNAGATAPAWVSMSGDATLSNGVITLATVPIAKGGTNITSYTAGDILYASATNVLSKMAVGSDRKFLGVSAGIPQWLYPTKCVVQTNVNYSAAASDYGATIVMTDNSNPRTLTLPPPGTVGAGFWLCVKKGGSSTTNTVTVARNGAETIDGRSVSDVLTAQNAYAVYTTDGTNWFVLACRDDLKNTLGSTSAGTTGNWKSFATLSIPPGIWVLDGNGAISANGATVTNVAIEVSTSLNASGGTVGDNLLSAKLPTTVTDGGANIPGVLAALTASSTTYYFNGIAFFSVATPNWFTRLSAQRVG